FGTDWEGDQQLTIPLSVFNTTDPVALAKVLFAGNDAINGTNLNDVIYGYAGDDLIYGGNGENRLYGGDGNDQVGGGSKNDKLYGDAGDDWLFGSKGNDKLFGGAGFDVAAYYGGLSPVKVNLSKGKVAKAKIGFN